jgi:FkbM family methyltransferase
VNTASKIRIARAIASLLRVIGVRQKRQARRGGIEFDLDLGEGIDLSVFLFGSFQRHLQRLIDHFVPADGVIIDVGANVGAVALAAARHVPQGHVYALEPTDYALRKLRRNLALNPELESRVTVTQSFVADTTRQSSDLTAFSSWPLIDTARPKHPVHQGVAMEGACGQITLDDYAAAEGIERVDLIKIDTDGHEFRVITGAGRIMAAARPVIVFEACEYLMRAPAPTFRDFETLLGGRGYRIVDPSTLQPMTEAEFLSSCPTGGGLDLVAIPTAGTR